MIKMHPHRRRKKKRPNCKNFRSLELLAVDGKYGFTVTGQKPCLLSSIVHQSPAEQAGLRSGDFLLSVNGKSVWNKDHEEIVTLIGSSHKIQITIADNYYSDSSDDDVTAAAHLRFRPKYPYNKSRMNRLQIDHPPIPEQARFSHTFEPPPPLPQLIEAHKVIQSPNARNTSDISNVSAMVNPNSLLNAAASSLMNSPESVSFRVIVGYLGTIEMPKQIATSSKLQTVRSCIRKLRQEKRNPALVLMNIMPSSLNLLNSNNTIIASYPSNRLNYVSSSSDSSKFFGLVTSAFHQEEQSGGAPCDSFEGIGIRKISISNSCHVFVIDTKLTDHLAHLSKAEKFNIICTKDLISNSCLEFPTASDYIVNIIKSMYNIKSPVKTENVPPVYRPSGMRNLNFERDQRMANSPHPSNHSEITTSSNSDSGIGFHNDYANISDRILVVDFPGLNPNRYIGARNPNQVPQYIQRQRVRPFGIVNDLQLQAIPQPSTSSELPVFHAKSKSADYNPVPHHEEINSRLAIRAMPDPIINSKGRSNGNYENIYPKAVTDVWYNGMTLDEAGHIVGERPIDVPDSFDCLDEDQRIMMVRSCDNIMMVMDKEEARYRKSSHHKAKHMNCVDDVVAEAMNDNHIFVAPKPPKKIMNKKSLTISGKTTDAKPKAERNLLHYKLSPKVFGLPRPVSMSFENLSSSSKRKSLWGSKSKKEKSHTTVSIWGSLHELRHSDALKNPQHDNILEGTYSEPSLHQIIDSDAKQMSSEISPFKRWGQSSLRARADIRTPLARRPSSLAVSENDVYAKTMQDQDDDAFCGSTRNATKEIVPVGPTTWGQSFELLLNDTAGLHTFAEFLKKEFSGENIYFWTACERFRHIDDISERAKEALAIFDKHLASGALEPVNIDSHARNTAQERLLSAEKDLFIHAQKQIFNLMKFDSYQRFIRSDLYKSCLDAEQKKIPLPYPGDQLDPILRISTHQQTSNSTMIKLKKSLSNAEDRRRKSILPWNRKTRCKSKDRGEVENIDSIKNSASSTNTLKLVSNHSAGDIHSSRSSLSSFDATISKIYSYDNDVGNRSSLCRVILSNGATTIVQTKPNETIRELVERLLEKRGIYYQAYEAFLSGNTKPLDIDGLSTQLAGNEVLIEQRVIFKLDLPNRKVISVKSKTCKILSDVLRPILHKYNYRLDLIQAYGKAYGPDALDLSLPVTAIDGQRLQIVCNDNGEMKPTNSFKLGNAPVTFVRANKLSTSASDPQLNTLDEITNKVFNELLQGKVNASNENESDDWGSETSSGIFNRMLRNPNKNKQATSKTSGGSDEGENAIRKPLIAKLKAGVKLQVTQNRTQNDETLLEGLKRAQRSRLEDQRGTEINFELPEFLKDKEKFASMGNKLRKTKFDESPSNSISLYNNIDAISESNHEQSKAAAASIHYTQQRRPQPAPRLSIAGKSPTKPSPEVSSVKSKIHSLENAIMLNSPTSSGKLFVNSRSNTPNELNASIQCLPSNTPMKSRSSDSPIYYSPDNGGSCICADTTMVFNHHHPNSSYESASDAIGFYSSGSQNDYQEIDDANGNRTSFKNEQEIHNCPPLLPPKPKIIPIKMSNWQSTNKENFFKVPLERRAPIAEGGVKNDVYLDQPTSSFV